MKKEATNDRVITKAAEDVMVGDRLYRSSGKHPVILKAVHKGLYSGFAWQEDGVRKVREMFSYEEIQIVLPNR